jgi:predicted P-loop ATPase
VWTSPPPFNSKVKRPIIDEDYVSIQHWFRERHLPKWSIVNVQLAVEWAAKQRAFHPVREYLDGLRWDGHQRIPTWLADYLGAPGSEASDLPPVGRWWLISAVARAKRPGCKADHMLVLEGPQGVGKSTAASILGGEWFSGELGDLRDKDAAQSLAGVWIVEMSELDAMRKADATRVKTFLTLRADHFRPSYGRNVVDRPRQCVFCGTTNENRYLQDPTGARRFWPVKIGGLDADALARDRDQLWAEAVALYQSGERWWPQGEQECAELATVAELRYTADPWEPILAELMESTTDSWTVSRLLSGVLHVEVERQDRAAATRVGAIMARLPSIEVVRVRIGNSRVATYYGPRSRRFHVV